MTRPTDPVARSRERVLALLAEGDGEGRAEGYDPIVLRVAAANGLRRLRLERSVLDRLLADRLVEERPAPENGGGRDLRLTATGLAHVRRRSDGEVDFRRQHGRLAPHRLGEGEAPVMVDEAESPLAWLARRRGKDGRAFLTPARCAAGERLRADFTLARMMPTVTSNWSAGRLSSGKGGRGGLADLTDRALAARDRVRGALEAVGTDLADVLIDVCCFLKGLETVESDRRWPARSAKVVLDIALGRLAAHYGLTEEARGPDRAHRLRAWGTGDHRPTTGTALDLLPPSG